VIAMIFIVSIIIFAGSTLVISGSKNAHTVSDMKQAHYMAEAGVEDALSDPFVITYALQIAYDASLPTPSPTSAPTPTPKENKGYTFYSPTPSPPPFQFEANKVGKYEVNAKANWESKELTITSTG